MAGSSLTIGALGKATGTKVETIRYYERIGLLPIPARSAANYRSYTDEHRKLLTFIRRSRALGFPIEQVRALLRLTDLRAQSCAEVDRIAADHVQAIEQKIAALTTLGDELRALIAQCRRGTISECRILEALAPGDFA
jgi:DNA-binding transcriptional MerR regulator